VFDAVGSGWREARKDGGKTKPKILLGPSNVAATSTSAGIRLFATDILPRLEQALGPEGFEVHVVGEGKPPEELQSCDIQLVPTAIVLGMRVRIVVGFSFGCCVVAHTNDRVNLPEMEDGRNALLGSNGEELANAIVRALRDPELRARLGENARSTYELYFAPDRAAAPIVAELERLARQRSLLETVGNV
jgi:hypothetical protein